MADFVVIDVETANPALTSICQIGVVRFSGGVEVDARSWLVDPQEYFDPINVSIHGINAEMVAGCSPLMAMFDQILPWLCGGTIVCHTHFDRTAIMQSQARWSLPAHDGVWLDSSRVARRAWADVANSGYGLANLAARLGITFRHHDALHDARTAGLILLRAIEDSRTTLDEWHSRVGGYLNPTGQKSVSREAGIEGPLFGQSVVFTGALLMPRRQAADRAQMLGAAVTPSITSATTMLVVGDQDISKLAGKQKSAKHLKAEAARAAGADIRIIGEADFLAF